MVGRYKKLCSPVCQTLCAGIVDIPATYLFMFRLPVYFFSKWSSPVYKYMLYRATWNFLSSVQVTGTNHISQWCRYNITPATGIIFTLVAGMTFSWCGGRVEERRRASAEKEKFTIEYTFRHPLLKRKLVVLGDVTVRCLSLVDLGHIFSKFYY